MVLAEGFGFFAPLRMTKEALGMIKEVLGMAPEGGGPSKPLRVLSVIC
jgi:hypothetical protein